MLTYTVAHASNIADLMKIVNTLLATGEGWALQGGIAVYSGNDGWTLLQAMTKK